MISSAIIPQPLARLPWRLIFLIAGISGIGIITLYSAAGGSAQPWATKQAIVILFFLSIAITMSWTSEATIKTVAFPLYGAVLVMLVVVEAVGFVGKGAQRWIDHQAGCPGGSLGREGAGCVGYPEAEARGAGRCGAGACLHGVSGLPKSISAR